MAIDLIYILCKTDRIHGLSRRRGGSVNIKFISWMHNSEFIMQNSSFVIQNSMIYNAKFRTSEKCETSGDILTDCSRFESRADERILIIAKHKNHHYKYKVHQV